MRGAALDYMVPLGRHRPECQGAARALWRVARPSAGCRRLCGKCCTRSSATGASPRRAHDREIEEGNHAHGHDQHIVGERVRSECQKHRPNERPFAAPDELEHAPDPEENRDPVHGGPDQAAVDEQAQIRVVR